jgi:hypothetical protein
MEIEGAVQDRGLSREQAGLRAPSEDAWQTRDRRLRRPLEALAGHDSYERAVAANFKYGLDNYQHAMKEAAQTGKPVVFVFSDRANTSADPRAGLIGKTKQLYGGSAQANNEAVYVFADLNDVRQNPNSGPARWLAEQGVRRPSIFVFGVDNNGKKTDGVLFEKLPRDPHALKGAIDDIKAARLPLLVPRDVPPPSPPVPNLPYPPGAGDANLPNRPLPQRSLPGGLPGVSESVPQGRPSEAHPQAPGSVPPRETGVVPPRSASATDSRAAVAPLESPATVPISLRSAAATESRPGVGPPENTGAPPALPADNGAVDNATRLLVGKPADGKMSYQTTHAQLERFMSEYEKYLASQGTPGAEPFSTDRAVKLYAKLKQLHAQERTRLDQADGVLAGSDLSAAAALKRKTAELRTHEEQEWAEHKPEDRLKDALLASQLHLLEHKPPEGQTGITSTTGGTPSSEGSEQLGKNWKTFKTLEESRLAQVGAFDSPEYADVVKKFETKYPRLSYTAFSKALAANNTYKNGDKLVQERDHAVQEIAQAAAAGDKEALQFFGKVLADNGKPLANDGSLVRLGKNEGLYITNSRRWTDTAAEALADAAKPENNKEDDRINVASVLSAAMVDPRVEGEARLRLMAGLRDLALPSSDGKPAPLSPSQECVVLMDAIKADTKAPNSQFQEQAIMRLAALKPETFGAYEVADFLRQLKTKTNGNVARVAQDALLRMEPDLPTILARTEADPELTASERAQAVRARLADPNQTGLYESVVKSYKDYEVTTTEKENYDQLKSLMENQAIDIRLRLFAAERFIHSCLGASDPALRSATNFVGGISVARDQVPADVAKDADGLTRDATPSCNHLLLQTNGGTILMSKERE